MLNGNAVADTGFSQGMGVNTPGRGPEHTILPNSPKDCMKLKEFRRLGGGGGRGSPRPLDPPLECNRKCLC